MSDAATCPSCGARVSPNQAACDLCGTPLVAEADEPRPPASDDMPGTACPSCGSTNPAGAQFCNQCGAGLASDEAAGEASADEGAEGIAGARPVQADLPRGKAPASPDESAAAPEAPADVQGPPVAWVVGGAVAVVLVLFGVTLWSQQTWPETPSEGPTTATQASAEQTAALPDLVTQYSAAVPEALVPQIDSLRRAIAQASGAPQQQVRQALVNVYIGAGQNGRAALVQRRLARQTGTAADWQRAGDLLYAWLDRVSNQPQGMPRTAITATADAIVQAYEKVLAQQPNNLDVRTEMATALLQTNQPMRGVQEINRVLAQDPEHYQARFNKGIMLVMIGRAQEAIAEFEKVQEIVGAGSPYYKQAAQAIETIQARLQADSSATPRTGARPVPSR
ncbi:zinc-ribbon domain-containing protein [Salisaeta longa]|uniref:zinc-ribbon domain-containing protein n=1 Tax=Salisaeta longa TaxID=503170 RepID=UPI0003B3A27F|nr:zinc-ribbon domain-containing protein [Salisaeta longa]